MPDPASDRSASDTPLPPPYVGLGSGLTKTLILLTVSALGACGSGPADAPLEARVEEVGSPAGEGSGEPFLSTSGDTVLLSWLEPAPEGGHALRLSRHVDGAWSRPLTVARRDDFFVNWADFPSVRRGPDGTLWAHWLQRGSAGGYDYGVRIVASEDEGATWSEALTPHEDGTAQEHGFVTLIPVDDGMGVAWLDGREYERGPEGAPPSEEMTLRFRAVGLDGGAATPTTPEEVLDGRTCDCCQTDAVLTSAGPLVVYRDRSDDEIRDIHVTRRVDGRWTAPTPVHRDGWHIEGCPVNGPAAAARGDRVVVAWFTAAGDEPRVKVSFSSDAGASFGPPVVVDDGNPAGRVDLLLDAGGGALVGWLERTGGDGAEVRLRRVSPAGEAGGSFAATRSSASRASGFPRLASLSDSTVLLAWTDVADTGPTRVRVARVQVPRP